MVAWVFAVRWETKRNVDLIKADGSKDSLKEGFHALRLFYRIMAALAIVFAASLPLWHHDPAMGLSMVGLMALFAGYFTRVFNPALNVARDKPEFYASVQPRAAWFPDRLAVRVARRASEKHGDPWESYLAYAYEAILNVTLGLCGVAYLASVGGVIWLLVK